MSGTVPADGLASGGLGVGGAIRNAGAVRRADTVPRRQPGPALAAAVPAVAALLASLAWSWRPGLWTDEDASVSAATRSFPALGHLLGKVDAADAVYFAFLHLWVAVAGTSAFAVRLPSAVAMAVAAAGVVAVGRRVTGSGSTAMAAGLAFAVLPTVSRYGMAAQSVAFGCAGAVWATWALVRALSAGRWRGWVLYGLLLGVAAAVQLPVLLLIAAHAVTLATVRPGRRTAVRWGAACLLAAVVAAPVAVLADRESTQTAWLARTSWSQLPAQVTRLFFEGSRPVALVAWALAVTAVVVSRRARTGADGVPAIDRVPGSDRVPGGDSGQGRNAAPRPGLLAVALPWAVLPAAILFVVSTRYPVYTPRYLVGAVPAVALLVGAGIAAARTRTAMAVLLLLLAAAGLRLDIAHRAVDGNDDDVVEVSRLIAAERLPGDAVLYRPAARRLAEIGDPAVLGTLDDVAAARTPVQSASLAGTEVGAAELTRRLAGVRRVWIVDRPGSAAGLRSSDVARKDAALAAVGFRQVHRWRTRDSELQLLVRI